MIPEKIGRYEIKQEIGRGGMATVYEAYDPRFERTVALKMLPREFMHEAEFRARFTREARTIATLEHPAIVPVYDFGEENGQPFLVMRLMTGGSLSDRLAEGPIPIDEAAIILKRLGSALDRAHSMGIIHRDLKPSNVLFDQYGDAFLADFGIVHVSSSTNALTASGSLVGTPTYMSPEQVYGDKQLDGRSDIYALGVILFQMLTGSTPYDADTPARMMMKHVMDPVPQILSVRPDLPPACNEIINKAMAKERDERFSSATDLSSALTAVTERNLEQPSMRKLEAELSEMKAELMEEVPPPPPPVRSTPSRLDFGDSYYDPTPTPAAGHQQPRPGALPHAERPNTDRQRWRA
jgi:serine/threonine protein kinase